MRLLKLLLFLLIPTFSQAATYYVSPTGSDGAPGSLLQPFKTIEKLASVLHAGDVGFVRGGLYLSTKTNAVAYHFWIHGLTGTAGNPITIQNYPGETVSFSCANITPTNANPFEFVVDNCNYVNFKGFKIKMLRQIADGSGVSRGLFPINSNNCKFEQIEVFCIGGTGVALDHSNNNYFLNCDSHHNGDGASPDQWNFGDAFTATGGDPSSGNTFDGCRAWINGDDNWDFFAWSGTSVYIKNCWSFWASVKPWGQTGTQPNEDSMTVENSAVWFGNPNYYTVAGLPASGEGFKLGGFNVGGPGPAGAPTTLKKWLDHCVSFENHGTGFTPNMAAQYSHQMSLQNCISFRNGNDGFGFGSGRSVGISMILKNNWAKDNDQFDSGGDISYDGNTGNISNNYWQTWHNGGAGYSNPGNLNAAFGGAVTITSGDFTSISPTGVTGARQSDGSLPNINFLKLVSGSDIIDKGVNINLSYCGSAPELGAFEYCTSITPTLPTANAGTNQALILPVNSTTLTGVGTGTSITTLWSKISGPAGYTITTPASATTTVTGLVKGVYQFEFKVTDGSMNVARDTMIVNVDEETPVVPTGVIMRSVTINRNGKAVVTWDSDATANSFVYIVQHKERLGYRPTGTSTPAVIGTKTYKGTYAAVKGDNYYMVCPVDIKGKPPCSAAMMVKKN